MDFLRRRLSEGNFLAGGGGSGGGGDPPGGGAGGGGGGAGGETPPGPILLVIAPPGTDWVKPFKGKSVHGDVELRVEQASFSELSLVASTHGDLSVSITPPRGGPRRVRPDFVLVREPPGGGAGGAPRRLLVGLHLGGVPSTHPLPALYAFAHPPCLFAQLAQLQRELGPKAFPLEPQRFCNRPRGLLTAPTFPMTVTLSPAPPGVGKVRVGTASALGAVAAAMGGSRAGALVGGAPGKGQRLRVQRIGEEYRELRWPPVAGDASGEGAQPEPVAPSPRHRGWVDACARLLGGGQICGVEALRGPDGTENIVQVLGPWLPLLGPGAGQDRAHIVELVLERMRAELPPPRPRPQIPLTPGSPRAGPPPQQRPPPQGAPPAPLGPAQPRPPPQGQPRPPGGVASPRPASPRPKTPPTSPQTRPPGTQPRPQSPQPRPQASPTSPQPRPQAPPTSPQPRPFGPQPRPQAPPASPRPPAPPTSPQPRPLGPQPRPQTPPSPQPRPQAPPPAAQPRPQAPPPTAQPRPQAPPPAAQPRPQAPPTSPQPRPQSPQPRPQTPPPAAQPRPSGPQATPTTRQPRPQAPPIAPKPPLAPKPAGAPPPSPAPEQGGAESIRSLRQSFASLFAD